MQIYVVQNVKMGDTVEIADYPYQQFAYPAEYADTDKPCFLLLEGSPETIRNSIDLSKLSPYETACIYDAVSNCTVFLFSQDIRFAFAEPNSVVSAQQTE